MPELPEVETVVRELKAKIIGKRFWKVQSETPSTFLPSFEKVAEQLQHLEVLNVTRRGKFIILVLEQKMFLVIHLRMTGRLMWKKVKDREKFIRAAFTFKDATSLFFSDVRKFGRIWLFHEKDYQNATGISRLGIEPFDPNLTLQGFTKIFKGKKGILKNTLLRQDIIAGIGNIYADEICFRIGVHPSSSLEKLSSAEIKKLYEAMLYCLEQGIIHCGVSVSDFVGINGKRGEHQNYLKVYGRKGEQCDTCGTTIQKTVVAGRGTFFCSFCQQLIL